MQQANQSWITMFRRIPGNLHETLVLGLRTGVEIVLQKMVKLEPDFMIIRGRVAGTQDTGRIILVPYGELSFVSCTRLLKDPEVEAIFGKGAPPAAADIALSAAEEGSTPSPDASAVEETATPQPLVEEVNVPKKPEMVSKTVLLAKLRERMKETNKPTP